jgi:hypothetical protein
MATNLVTQLFCKSVSEFNTLLQRHPNPILKINYRQLLDIRHAA